MIELEAHFNQKYLKSLFFSRLDDSSAKGIDKLNCYSVSDNINDLVGIIEKKVIQSEYKFSPYVEVLRSKGRNKYPRIISIPTIRDRIALLAAKEMLHKLFPQSVNKQRPNHFISDIKKFVKRGGPDMEFVKLDVRQFYDNVDRDILIGKLTTHGVDARLVHLIRDAISTPIIPENTLKADYTDFHTEKGVPQGLSISNILAQIYLIELDDLIRKRRYFYKRYVDDILILNDGPISKYRVDNIASSLKSIGLEINKEKTESGNIDVGFEFLGYKIIGKKISIADHNIQNFIKRIAGKVTWFKNGFTNKDRRPEWLIDNDDRFKEVFVEELNEAITGIISSSKNYGWLFYYSQVDDLSLLFKLDKIIKSFFKNLIAFNHKAPDNLKKLVKAYHTIIFEEDKSYIANYDSYDTIKRKREFLIFRGFIDPGIGYTDLRIETLFKKFTQKQIDSVEEDIGYNY